jgi:hypothetical protein
MAKFKIIVIGAVVIAGSIVSLGIQRQAEVKLQENDAVLRQQVDQLSEKTEERQRLSNLIAQATTSPSEDHTAELVKLRSEAAALRKQTNQLGQQHAENRTARLWQAASKPDSSTSQISAEVVSDSNSEEYKVQLYRLACAAPHSPPLTNNRTMGDARNLSSAIRKYAREHEGEFPTNFDQAAPYVYKDQELPRTSEFEMVFQGSLNELTNIPPSAVALIRERQAWPTPSGKWARIYVMTFGEVRVVESDDNFHYWEAAHVIPPPASGQ